jgi:signal transduction histidine kinase
VFERFRRLDDQTTRATGGAGIGLYIARRLARMMDGDLVVGASEQGTRMILTLPAAHHLAAVG